MFQDHLVGQHFCQNENVKKHFDGNNLGKKYETNFNNMIPR